MEKSLSVKLAARNKFRYTTVLSLALLAFMFGSMILGKNPKESEADTVSVADSGLEIQKKLEAYSRGGVFATDCSGSSPMNCFNPYAVQNGDVIKVNLTIIGAAATTTMATTTINITDTKLKIPNGPGSSTGSNVRCDTVDALLPSPAILNSGVEEGADVFWDSVPTDISGSASVSYYCIIK